MSEINEAEIANGVTASWHWLSGWKTWRVQVNFYNGYMPTRFGAVSDEAEILPKAKELAKASCEALICELQYMLKELDDGK